jgi:hypothetical protein
MIELVLKLLEIDEFYNEGEFIEFAKGRYKLEETVNGLVKQKQRIKKWQSKKQ